MLKVTLTSGIVLFYDSETAILKHSPYWEIVTGRDGKKSVYNHSCTVNRIVGTIEEV